MQTATEILQKGRKVIEAAIDKEMFSQGHYLTGNLQRSKTATITQSKEETILEGEIAFYANILNNGVPAAHASMKQFPFVVKFFQLRGLPEKEAKRAAAATIKKWMKQGMPTFASSRFSESGERKHMLDLSVRKGATNADKVILAEIDKEINLNFGRTKSETI